MTPNVVNRLASVAAVSIVLFTFTAVASAGQVWGIQPATNQIVRVNPATGATFAGFTPPGGALHPAQEFGGLTIAERGATLLYQNPVTNPTDLFRLNPNTGALLSTEFMPAAQSPLFRAGLSFQSGAGAGGADAVYAINDGAPVQRQDGYGNPVLVNHTPSGAEFAGALGGDDNGRQFLAVIGNVAASGAILEFDPSNPNVVLNTLPSPPLQGPFSPAGGLAFDGRRLYFSRLNGQLFTLDPDTGAVLNTVVVQGGALIGLAARIPEPSSALLLVIGGLLLVWPARRCPATERDDKSRRVTNVF